jgi:RNA polymerase sigma-70 factor (ECF subfamily)
MSEFASEQRIADTAAVTAAPSRPADARLSPAEVVETIRSLGDGEKSALVKIARAYAGKTPYNAEDLIQEAFTRVLEGRRAWPRDVPVVLFLGGVVRSIAWEWRAEPPNRGPDGGDAGAEERSAIARIDAGKIVALFEDDPLAQRIVVGWMEGMRGEELERVSGLSKTDYESKRRKIRRRIEKLSL